MDRKARIRQKTKIALKKALKDKELVITIAQRVYESELCKSQPVLEATEDRIAEMAENVADEVVTQFAKKASKILA